MSRRFVRDTAIGGMLGVKPGEVRLNPSSLIKGIWGLTGGAFMEGLRGSSDDKPNSEPAVVEEPLCNIKTGPMYQYAPVPLSGDQRQIRLLELLPGSKQDDINCNILLVSLNDFPKYEALSYCWGDTNEMTPIQINEYTLNVTKNLRSALFHLREESNPRKLWIDAICIHQDDLDERGQQVGIMRDIYKDATRTVVWLGDADEDSDLAFSTCHTLTSHARESAQLESTTSAESTVTNPEVEGLKNDTSVENLVTRPWWTRVWVVQEIALATDAVIVCGTQQMDWKTFCQAVETGLSLEVWEVFMFGIADSDGFQYYKSITTIQRAIPADTPGDHLLELLIHLREHQATDERDKVFSVLGLLEGSLEELGVIPDYQDSSHNVFKKTAASIIKSSKNLDVFGVCSSGQFMKSHLYLPSWVPDWSCDEWIPQPFRTDARGNNRKTSASRRTKATPTFSNDSDILVLSGYTIDSIATFAEVLRRMDESMWNDIGNNYPDDASLLATLGAVGKEMGLMYDSLTYLIPLLSIYIKWEEFAKVGDPLLIKRTPGGTELETISVYWQTLCAGCTSNGLATTEILYREWYASLAPIRNLLRWRMDRYAFRSVFKPLGFVSYLRATWERYPEFGRLLAHTKGRRLAWTEQGRLCLVPEDVREGDAVILAEGGRVPLIVRHDGAEYNGSLTWRLVGECYVHGVMDGEVFDQDACREMLFR